MNKIKKNKILVCLLIFIICSLTGCKGFRAYTINDYDLYVNFCESINTCNDDGILALFCDDIKNDKTIDDQIIYLINMFDRNINYTENEEKKIGNHKEKKERNYIKTTNFDIKDMDGHRYEIYIQFKIKKNYWRVKDNQGEGIHYFKIIKYDKNDEKKVIDSLEIGKKIRKYF